MIFNENIRENIRKYHLVRPQSNKNSSIGVRIVGMFYCIGHTYMMLTLKRYKDGICSSPRQNEVWQKAFFKVEAHRLKHTWLVKVKLVTIVKGKPKAPFSIATRPRCRKGCYSFPWIAPLYPWYLPYNKVSVV